MPAPATAAGGGTDRPSRPPPPPGPPPPGPNGSSGKRRAKAAKAANAAAAAGTGSGVAAAPGSASVAAATIAAASGSAVNPQQTSSASLLPQPGLAQAQQPSLASAASAGEAGGGAESPAKRTGGQRGLQAATPPPLAQLQLSEAELKSEVPRMLTAGDGGAQGVGSSGGSRVRFSYRERAFKQEPPGPADMLAVHLAMEGSLLPKESPEAQAQRAYEERRVDDAAVARRAAREEAVQAGEEAFLVDDDASSRGGRGGFTFWERAVQTADLPRKEKGVGTEPPPVLTFAATCTQWEIYDAYLEQLHWSRLQPAQASSAGASASSSSASTILFAAGANDPAGGGGNGQAAALPDAGEKQRGYGVRGGPDVVHSERMARALATLERMAGQNAEDEIYHDCAFWDDPSDAMRAQGTLLPLWYFATERTRRHQVTALSWNPRHPDLFAAGYGSYAFEHQGGGGLVACFSLKNTGTPQYTFATDSGVMALDFHPQLPHLLAVGCHDGRVLVFDLLLQQQPQGRGSNKPLYASSVRTGRHTEPVWAVKWQPLDGSSSASSLVGSGGGGPGRELAFYSISSDGQVACWLLARTELRMEGMMQLKLVPVGAGGGGVGGGDGVLEGLAGLTGLGQEAAALSLLSDDRGGADSGSLGSGAGGLATGTCLDFNALPGCDHLFLVGTEEGRVHKCSKAYSGQYLETYAGHHMAVYAVRWNPFHPRLFLSCSADWTVKLWDHARPQAPLLSFDLGNSVGDVQWSPHAASAFAAVTGDGRVHVFDLASNKHEPLCVQKVARRAKLTHVAFNPAKHPAVLLVGDDRGEVHSLKLSPNLRNEHEPRDEGGSVLPHDAARLQFNTAERILQALLAEAEAGEGGSGKGQK